MSNRLTSILILAITFWAIYWFYYYFFVINKWALTINSNTDNYNVSLYNNNLKTSFSSFCKNKKCELIDIAPFEYDLTISKDWYKDYKTSIKVEKKSTLELKISIEKQLQIKEIDDKISDDETKNLQSNQEKLDKFKELAVLQKSYSFFNLDELGYFYFVNNNDNTLTLMSKINNVEKKLYVFNKIEKNYIDLQKVYQSDNMIFISYKDDKYLYNLDSWNIDKVFFPQKINYVKKDWNIYSFVNDKWTFLYDIQTKKIEYFYLFKDFVYYDNQNYFWIIFNDETDKKKNYNLEDNDENLIVKYNFNTRNIKILEKTSINVKKIIKSSDWIYFYDEYDNKYLVDNIE